MRVSHYLFVAVTLLIPAICLAQNGANGGAPAAERIQVAVHVAGGVTTLWQVL